MIREKIFRLQRHKSSASSAGTDASVEKIDFTFSNIQALQVPIGWDKLSLSMISSETGKIVRKSGKVTVKNGTCRWTETLTESVWISDVADSKEHEQYLFKFIVAMGSSRSGILGEATVNLAAFLSSEAPTLVSLPLKKCTYGTILQVEVKCLTPKTNVRDEKWKELNMRKHENTNNEDVIDKSEEPSDFTIAKRSSDKFSIALRQRELGSRETSFSTSVSSYSFNSMDEAMGGQSLSSQSNQKTANYAVGRQDSIESHEDRSYCSYSTFDSPKSDGSCQNPLAKDSLSKNQREDLIRKSSLQQSAGCSKMSKEVDDSVVDVLRAEARMWEQNARKLGLEVDTLRKELDDQSLNMKVLNTELDKSRSDGQKLREEILSLRTALEEHERTRDSLQKEELEDEIRFQKQSNENLMLQMKKTQESNIELISILQEMEETIEKQKLEIEILSAPKLLESMDANEKNNCISDECTEPTVVDDVVQDLQLSDSDSSVSGISVTDIESQIPQENKCYLEFEFLDLQKKLQAEILHLESILEDKVIEAKIEQDIKNQILRECEVECKYILAEKDQKIMKLEAELSGALCPKDSAENEVRVNASKEIKRLEEKVKELETDCDELTEENLQLLLQLKELRKDLPQGSETGFNSDDEEKQVDVPSEKCDLKIQESELVIDGDSNDNSLASIDKNNEMRLMESGNKQIPLVKHLTDLEEENVYLSERISGLEAQLRYLTETNESSRLELQHSESLVLNLRDEIQRLEKEIESQEEDNKQKVLKMEKRWSQAQEECRSLSKVNVKLQATAESLIEDHNSLQKHNEELKEQKLKLQEQCMAFEGKVRQARNSLCSCSETFVVKDSLTEQEITAPGRTLEENLETSFSDKEEKDPKLCENMMKDAEELEGIIDELDLRVKVSEIERIRLAEENSVLHMQLEKVPLLQNEVIGLRISLKEIKLQNQFLKASFKSVSSDYEKLKSECSSLLRRVSELQKTASEVEDWRRKNIALEEKILRLEGDLIAKDASSVQDNEMRNELAQIKRLNSLLQMKVKHLEDLREELEKQVQSLEEELKQTGQGKEDQNLPKKEADESMDKDQRDIILCSHLSQDRRNQGIVHHQVQDLNKQVSCFGDCESRIQFLEKELPEALEAKDNHKTQCERAESNVLGKLQHEEASVDASKNEHKIPLLEAELQEMRERYLQMSLKYAEVEAQREQLVMKLKTLNSWSSFSQR